MKIFTKTIKSAFIVLLLGLTTITVQAQSGNVLDFDGVNDYVEIPNLKLLSPASVEFWVRIKANNGNPQSLITSGGISGSKYYGFGFYALPDDKWYVFVDNGGSNYLTLQGPPISYNTWTHLAATYDGKIVRFYVNGSLANSVSAPLIAGNNLFPTRIGAGNSEGAPKYFFGGDIDELSFWQQTLSSSQISSNMMNPLTGTESNLLFYYNFNQGVGNGDNTTPPVNTLIDSKNSKNGNLNNFALNGTLSNWISATSLPVNLVSFTGANRDGTNLLQWSTASEQNSSRFEVERSENGNDFSTIATVGAAGNSDKLINYQYEDKQLANIAKYYYRLKMVDKDGATKYSAVIFIKNSISSLATVYPNPARDKVTINISDNSLLHTMALLTDANGKVLQRISINSTATPVSLSQYVRGMYLVKFQDGSSVKIVKE